MLPALVKAPSAARLNINTEFPSVALVEVYTAPTLFSREASSPEA
jgi:hypothetical protein